MTRLLVLLAVALYITYLAIEGLRRLRGKLNELLADPVPRPQGDALVACATCGVHVPQQHAREAGGGTGKRSGFSTRRLYCSETCRRRALAAAAEASARSA